MHLARFAGFNDQTDARPGAFANQNDDARPETASKAGMGACSRSMPRSERIRMLTPRSMASLACAHSLSIALFQTLLPFGNLVKNGKSDGLEIRAVKVLELGEFLVGQDGRLEFDQAATLRHGRKQIALGPDGRLRRGDQFLADAIDGWIGNLGEELLEIIVKALGLVGKHRERRVRAPSEPMASTPSRAMGAMMMRKSSKV